MIGEQIRYIKEFSLEDYALLYKNRSSFYGEMNKFSCNKISPLLAENLTDMGYDGKTIYYFSAIVHGFPDKKFVEVFIKKAGSKENLETLCDLEEFLINWGFKIDENKVKYEESLQSIGVR